MSIQRHPETGKIIAKKFTLEQIEEADVDGGENPRIDGAVVSLAASSGLFETMMARV